MLDVFFLFVRVTSSTSGDGVSVSSFGGGHMRSAQIHRSEGETSESSQVLKRRDR